MNSEKVKEIKKDIEICMKSLNCNGCSHHSQRSGECCRNLTNDILTYINEMESENESLRQERDILIGKKIVEKQKYDNALIVKIDIQEQLKDRIAELEKENETKTDTITDLLKKQEFYEKEKLKQFAERLKEKMGVREYMGIKYKQGVFSENDIDETLKEFEL